MANVLPKETLQVEWNRSRNRFVLVGALVLLGTAVLSALALLPAHVALQVEKSITTGQSIKEPSTLHNANQLEQSERSDIIRTQALLNSVGPIVFTTSSPTETISAVLGVRPSGMLVDHITIVYGEKGTLTIEGISPGRESINKYKKSLSESGRFKSVSVPVGTLVGTDGGRFIITLSGIL